MDEVEQHKRERLKRKAARLQNLEPGEGEHGGKR